VGEQLARDAVSALRIGLASRQAGERVMSGQSVGLDNAFRFGVPLGGRRFVRARPGLSVLSTIHRMSDAATELLHSLGHIYGVHGQTKRALVLQLIAARLAPNNPGILRSLAYGFLMDDEPERALAVIDRLETLEGSESPAFHLLKSRALWASGRELEARRSFRDYLERRKAP
jgi:type III secretion protein Y